MFSSNQTRFEIGIVEHFEQADRRNDEIIYKAEHSQAWAENLEHCEHDPVGGEGANEGG